MGLFLEISFLITENPNEVGFGVCIILRSKKCFNSKKVTNQKVFKVWRSGRIMDKTNQLEEIMWEFGKFWNSEGTEVNPEPIGKPKTIYSNTFNEFVWELKLNNLKKEYKEFGPNAYSKGEITCPNPREDLKACSIQLYKI